MAFVFFTDHADLIPLKVWPLHHQVTIQVDLHGIDCVSHYKLFLCDSDKICHDQLVEQSGNFTFKNLKDGETYAYQLVGYDDGSEKETYLSEENYFETPLNVTTLFQIDKVSNDSATLSFHSSVFNHWKERENLKRFTVLAHCQPDKFKQVSNVKTLNLLDLDPFTNYLCEGQFEYGDEFYDIEEIEFKTLHGIPEKPENLIVEKIDEEEAEIAWSPPKIQNGVVQKYKIWVRKACENDAKIDPFCHDLCKESQFTILKDNSTYIILDKLAPWTLYEVKIAAKTEHETFGDWSDPIRFKTLPSAPESHDILKMSQTKKGGLMIDFHIKCPLTGPTTFTGTNFYIHTRDLKKPRRNYRIENCNMNFS